MRAAGSTRFILQPLESKENSNMARPQKPDGRKPATKFPNLTKKMDKSKAKVANNKLHVRKSGNR